MKSQKYNIETSKSEFKPTLPIVMVLANKIINQLGFVTRINEGVVADAESWSVDPGRLLKALVLSTFVDMRAPLSHVSDRLKAFDLEYLLDKQGVKVEELNAFSIGRALERLGMACPDSIYEAMALEAITQNNIPVNRLHSDTTSVSFYGDYDISKLDLSTKEKEEILKIERGYNKDGRPGCAQLINGQVVNEFGIPVISRTMDGSTSDIEWNKQALTYLDGIIEAGFDGIYVADSKLVFEDAVEVMFDEKRPIKFVSRMPANFEHGMEARTIKQAYADGGWEDFGAFHEGPLASVYRCRPYTEKLYGNNVRLLVLESSSLVYKARQGLDKEAEKAAKALKKLNGMVFEEEKHAQVELNRFEKKWHCFDYGLTVEKKTKIKYPKGRRKADTKGQEIITYHIHAQTEIWRIHPCNEYLRNESCIVIISNAVEGYTDSQLFNIYKGQQVVENSFRLLKEPQLASVIYLKNPIRIKGLMMVLSFSLLIRAIIQFKLREGLKVYKTENNGKSPKVGWNNRPLENPTYKMLYEHTYNCHFTKENSNTYSFIWLDDTTEKRVTTLLLLMGYAVDVLLD